MLISDFVEVLRQVNILGDRVEILPVVVRILVLRLDWLSFEMWRFLRVRHCVHEGMVTGEVVEVHGDGAQGAQVAHVVMLAQGGLISLFELPLLLYLLLEEVVHRPVCSRALAFVEVAWQR